MSKKTQQKPSTVPKNDPANPNSPKNPMNPNPTPETPTAVDEVKV